MSIVSDLKDSVGVGKMRGLSNWGDDGTRGETREPGGWSSASNVRDWGSSTKALRLLA